MPCARALSRKSRTRSPCRPSQNESAQYLAMYRITRNKGQRSLWCNQCSKWNRRIFKFYLFAGLWSLSDLTRITKDHSSFSRMKDEKNHTAEFDYGCPWPNACTGRHTPQGREGTHTCPSSWAMVKAALSPFSSLMEQLREGSHRVPSSAKPKMSHMHTSSEWEAATWN